jgi:hypothetical protein
MVLLVRFKVNFIDIPRPLEMSSAFVMFCCVWLTQAAALNRASLYAAFFCNVCVSALSVLLLTDVPLTHEP